MYEDIKTLSISYPLVGVYNDIAKNIVDAKIVVVLDTPPTNTTITDICIKLLSISSSMAVVKVSLIDYGEYSLSVPIVAIDYNAIPNTQSYILVKEPITKESDNLNYDIHPDCLIVMQSAPTINIGLRYNPVNEEEATTEVLAIQDAIIIESGYNVNINGSDGYLYIEAEAGSGKGRFPITPLLPDADGTEVYRAKGLISINGITDNINISTMSKDVAITTEVMTEEELVAYGDNITVGVTLHINRATETEPQQME